MSDEPASRVEYPKNGAVFLLSKHNENAIAIATLLDELAKRDTELQTPEDQRNYPPSGSAYLMSRLNDQTGTTAALVDMLVRRDQAVAEKRAASGDKTEPAF